MGLARPAALVRAAISIILAPPGTKGGLSLQAIRSYWSGRHPLEGVEPAVRLQARERAAQPRLRDFRQQLLDQGFGLLVGHVFGERDGVLDDLLVYLIGVLGVVPEGQVPAYKLVQADPDTPQIDVEAIPLPGKHLRRHIMRRADNGVCLVHSWLERLAGAHIDQPENPSFVDHHVLGLEVAVDDALGVQVFDAEDHRSYVELGVGGLEQADLADHVEQLHASDEFHQEVDVVLVFVRPDVLQHQRVVHQRKHVFLLGQVLFQLGLDNLTLRNTLECKGVLPRLGMHKVHGAELPEPQFLQRDQVRQRHFRHLLFLAQQFISIFRVMLACFHDLADGLLEVATHGFVEGLECDLCGGAFFGGLDCEGVLLVCVGWAQAVLAEE
jgi:hypothetical protein